MCEFEEGRARSKRVGKKVCLSLREMLIDHETCANDVGRRKGRDEGRERRGKREEEGEEGSLKAESVCLRMQVPQRDEDEDGLWVAAVHMYMRAVWLAAAVVVAAAACVVAVAVVGGVRFRPPWARVERRQRQRQRPRRSRWPGELQQQQQR